MRAFALVALVATTASAGPGGPPDATRGADSKKDVLLAAKTEAHGPLPALGVKPRALVNLYNEWTNEWLAVDPRALPPTATIDRFLRDHYTNKGTTMDPRLIGILLHAAADFHSDTVHIVSGFRHPKYNLMLRKKGHQVARDSEHTHGNAVDFFIPNVPTTRLHAWAKEQKIGGVGLYLQSAFVHMDTGRIRYWSGD